MELLEASAHRTVPHVVVYPFTIFHHDIPNTTEQHCNVSTLEHHNNTTLSNTLHHTVL